MGYRERKREKLDRIYEEHKDNVYKICLFFLKDEELAVEFSQQTFLNFYLHIDDVGIESVHAYLVRMARNLCFDYLKLQKREELQDSLESLEEEMEPVISVEEAILRREELRQEIELGRDIMEHIRKENEQWYIALNLLFCLDKPHDVVADEMGISRDALYSLVYRARKWIRKKYMKKYNDITK